MFKNQKGFTLVELVLVMVILGVLMSIAIPKFSNVSKNTDINSVETTLRTVKNGLQQHYIDDKEGDLDLNAINRYSDYSFIQVSTNADVQVYKTEIEKDPWGNPYYLYVSNKGTKSFTLMSYGPNAKKDPDVKALVDDIVFIFYPKFY